MKKGNYRYFIISICLLTSFLLWTAAVLSVDVRAIGPQGSTVGFAAVNSFVHSITGVHMTLYTVTDWLGLVPICFAFFFALMGHFQWVMRRKLLKVDRSLLVLGVFYIVVIAVYILFETVVVNYRPVLISGILEASYPSSTTMLVMCVMPTAVLQFNARIKNNALKRFIASAITAFIVFMVIGRLISGVHWFTDIVGGALLSAGLVTMYRFVTSR